ncbi:MAG: hypothetical protein GWN18_08050, partial [Thermoplasmata archaeon]|nr:hypothetical protein [Thermoplasmata archaeon]NIS19919.1 hypothetical protein [Thermoplasmata archaeon]NIU49029.1 hypothetical protein [Thermoplasmata archaeon]NIV78680.1 hypothetical protein [Thermoplasmata archaeon]NIW82516.1 hypothetical protein [Thermoplasmata archaeon]
HDAGMHMAVHASSLEEIRSAAEMRVGSIEHMGYGNRPRYDDEAVELMVRGGIFWVPTVVHNLLIDIHKEIPERLDNPQLEADLPPDLYADVRQSLERPSR